MPKYSISPPWIAYPDSSPSDIFWRQEGEIWALNLWLPFWTSLNDTDRMNYLKMWDAPPEWQEFYDTSFQTELASMDGIPGWILRNNLTPCDDDFPRYISVNKKSSPLSSIFQKTVSYLKSDYPYLLIGIIIVVIAKYFGFM